MVHGVAVSLARWEEEEEEMNQDKEECDEDGEDESSTTQGEEWKEGRPTVVHYYLYLKGREQHWMVRTSLLVHWQGGGRRE